MVKKYTINREIAGKYRIAYENELDSQQLAVATAGKGPILVIAGAGSGKTRALTYRVARLIEDGASPDRILLLTFTNKAAREMLKRVESLLGNASTRVWGGTFHSVCSRILRRSGAVLGYQSNFSILDSEDARDLLEACIEASGLDIKDKRFPKPNVILEMLSTSLNKNITLENVLVAFGPAFIQFRQPIEKILALYAERKLARNVMDFDDLLVNTKRLLLEHPEVKQFWCSSFDYILVDEFQDTNLLQSQLVDLLAQTHRNIMAVGDDAQSIYAFRGAHFDNMYKFTDRYADATLLKLEHNYRSNPEILDLANYSIQGNRKQFSKVLRATRPACGERPGLIPARDADEQAAFVASRILELRDQSMDLSEMAILYRSHWQSLELQLELTRRDIPYIIRSGLKFFEQAHIKDILAYIKVLVNPRDEIAWKRLFKQVQGVGKALATKLWEQMSARPDPLHYLLHTNEPVKTRAPLAWQAFIELLMQISQAEFLKLPGVQIELILNSYFSEFVRTSYENATVRLEDIEQLGHFAGRYDSSENFLAELSLLSSERVSGPGGLAGEDPGADLDNENEGKVVLSTIHQAKGLEWRVVFLIWATDGKLPSARALREDGGEEEERRVFYVALTRAKDELDICYPLTERDYSKLTVVQRPSRFISEIPPEKFELWELG